MGSDESSFHVSLIVRDKVTRQCPQTTTFEGKRRAEANSNRGPSAYQPNALPLGQTGSQNNQQQKEQEKKKPSPVVYVPSISGTLGDTGVYKHETEPMFI